MFAQLSKCLYCIWPGVIIIVGMFLWRGVNAKTYYGALPVGIDPLKAEGQPCFETQRQRDAEKRRIIYWCVGIFAAGILVFIVSNSAILKTNQTEIPTPTVTVTPTIPIIQLP